MLKKFLRRLAGRRADPAIPEELPLDPLTVLAVDSQPKPIELIDVDNLFFPWLLGIGEPTSRELNDDETRMLRALKREADAGDESTADLVPRIPAVIPLLLRSLRAAEISNQQLAAQVAQDPVLLAAVLHQVNSSYYRRAAEIRTVEDAVAILGQNGLRMLVARVAFKPLFSAELGRFTSLGAPRIWALADPFGVACSCIASRRAMGSFEAYLAGLLRNVGVIVALRVMDRTGSTAADLHSLAFCASFAHYTRRLAHLVGRHWEFPLAAIAALDRETQQADPELAEVVHLADRAAKVRLLVRNGALREEHAEACLEGEDLQACYRRIMETEADRNASAS